MMSIVRSTLAGATIAAVLVAGGAFAQSAVEGAVKARKAHMGLYGFNIGPLVAMAKGEMDYDAELASTLAANLAALNSVSMSRYFPPGSAKGEIEGTRALPALWQDGEDVMAKVAALNEAITALNASAGTDLASLQAAVGAVGKACGDCHEAYRAPE